MLLAAGDLGLEPVVGKVELEAETDLVDEVATLVGDCLLYTSDAADE